MSKNFLDAVEVQPVDYSKSEHIAPMPVKFNKNNLIVFFWSITSFTLFFTVQTAGLASMAIQLLWVLQYRKSSVYKARQHFLRARHFIKDNKPSKALNSFKEILKLEPDAVTLYPVIGDLYLRNGDKEKALYYYNEYFRINSEDYAVKVRVTLLLFQEKMYSEIIQILEELPDDIRNDNFIIIVRAYSFIFQNDGKKALDVLSFKDIDRMSNEEKIVYYYLFGLAYRKNNQVEKAIESLEEVYRLNDEGFLNSNIVLNKLKKDQAVQ